MMLNPQLSSSKLKVGSRFEAWASIMSITKFHISIKKTQLTPKLYRIKSGKGNKKFSKELYFPSFFSNDHYSFQVCCISRVLVLKQRIFYFWSQIFIYTTVPFHALQHFSLEIKVNVSFSENAKELNCPSSRAESRNVQCNGVMSVCECVHFVFIQDCVARTSSEVSDRSPYLQESVVLLNVIWCWLYSASLLMQHNNPQSKTQVKSFIAKCQDLISTMCFLWRSVYVFPSWQM